MIEQKFLYAENVRYKRFAYCVIRDAIAFYFGIPKLFKEDNYTNALNNLINDKLTNLEKSKNRPLTEKEIAKCIRLTEKIMTVRLQELTTDYDHCKEVLFEDNIWLQLLNLNADFLKNFLNRLPQDTKDELAVVPKWNTRDHSLGRPYINDNFEIPTGIF